MTFRARNAYYLRISTNVVLPLFLYLDERHIDWMSDVVLQHVLSDLRPLSHRVIPKLQTEKDVHFGSGAAPGTKRGTVEVHRGESYQFAYFFRKTEPHTVLFKSRYFVTAPLRPGVVPSSASRPADRGSQSKRSRAQAPIGQSKRKRNKTNRKGNFSPNRLDEDEWTAEESEEDIDDADPISREPRLVRKQRRIITNVYQEDGGDDAEAVLHDIAMKSPPPETGGESSGDPAAYVKPLLLPDIVIEKVDQSSPFVNDEDAAARDTNDRSSRSPPDAADIELVVEEEEDKPKPLLKLKYQSFSISGHCLCVVVEPWPPQRAETKLRFGTSISLERSLRPSNPSDIGGQRAKTPLFFPDNDRAPIEVPSARERTLPPVLLFPNAMSGAEDDIHSDDDLMSFSQTLNAAGHMHAIAADDDDDIDGAVLFGDADEMRELL